MDKKERLDLLDQAIDLVAEAQEMAEEAVAGTSEEQHFNAYGKYGFDQLLDNGNPYDYGLLKLKQNLGR